MNAGKLYTFQKIFPVIEIARFKSFFECFDVCIDLRFVLPLANPSSKLFGHKGRFTSRDIVLNSVSPRQEWARKD